MYDSQETQVDKVLKGVVRAEKIPDPDSYIQPILDRVQTKHITDMFGVHSWTSSEDFLNQVAARTGKLLKGGEPDINNVAKAMIMDWQRGNIPYFTKAPHVDKDAVNMTRQVGEMFAARFEEQQAQADNIQNITE